MSSRAYRILLVLYWLLLGLPGSVGCEPSAKRDEEVPLPIDSSPDPGAEAELIEHLRALGYLAASEEAGDSHGVILHEMGRTAPGLNLLTSGHGPVALLMGMDGTVRHEWRAEFEEVFPDHPKSERAAELHRNFWRDALLFPNGDIVVIWELFGIFKLDRDSRVLWAVPELAHHEIRLTEMGEIAHLQAKRKMIRGIPEKKAIEDFIVVRDGSGNEQRRLALSDALLNVNWLKLRRLFWARARERGYGLDEKNILDPFHANSLWFLTTAEAARLGHPFQPGDALVSMAMLDTIAILDMEKGEARWSQQGPFGMQHSPRVTPEGTIILFNNFSTANRSSVLTLHPRTRLVIQEYTGPKSDPLYSRRSGRVQMLPNGNTLVIETDGGRAIELAEDGEVVWEFRSPYRAGEGAEKVAHLYSLKRVKENQVSWLTSEPESGIDD